MSRKEAKRLKKASAKSAAQMNGGDRQIVDTSPYVHQSDKLDWTLSVRGRNDLTDRQKEIIDKILDKKTKILFLTGPAGTSKTWLAVYCGLLLLQRCTMSHITFVRTIVESASKSLGTLPGEAGDKLSPYMMPLMDKLEEMVSAGDMKRLLAEERVRGLPINYLRGASFNAQYIVLEEAQNYTLKELTTALTRIGQYSKMVIIGDPDQSDLPSAASGLMPMYDLFNDESSREQGIHCMALTKDDIVRSGVLRYIAERLENYRASHAPGR